MRREQFCELPKDGTLCMVGGGPARLMESVVNLEPGERESSASRIHGGGGDR